MSHVQLIAGLGNPGPQYERTRHNLGFMLVDALAEKLGSGSAAWRDKGSAHVCELGSGPDRLMLIKPQTFMNLSGQPLAELANFLKIPPSAIVVAHDEVDIPLGALRMKQGGGDGGHNGIKSVAQCLGSGDFVRVRLGVGRPAAQDAAQSERSTADWVLGRFTVEERSVVQELLTRGVLAIECLRSEGLKAAQNKFNA